MEETKVKQKRKYAIFSEESIKTFAESSCGKPIDEDVYMSLSEDVSYRLRELITNASQIIKHKGKRKLTCDDINHALIDSSSPAIYGYGHDLKPIQDVYNPEANVFVSQDPEIKITPLANSILTNEYKLDLKLKSRQLNLGWLKVEGSIERDLLTSDPQERSTQISPNLMTYYHQLAEIILSDDEEAIEFALKDISKNMHVQENPPVYSLFYYRWDE